jgi:hypothetical protein
MLTNVFQSGVQLNTGNSINISSVPQNPNTEAYSIAFTGALTGSSPVGSSYQTAVAQHVFTADAPCQVVAVTERHSVLGSTTGMLVHAIGSTPLGSGANVLASTIDHTAAVDVYRTGTLINSTTLTQLATGDALGWRFTTPGNYPPVGGVTVTLAYI